MTCSEIRPLLMDYAWRRLSPAEAGAVEIHLGGCDACRTVLAEERALGETLAAIPVVAPRQDLWESVRLRQMALVNARPVRARAWHLPFSATARGMGWRPWTVAVAAGIAALALMLAPGRPGRKAVEPGNGGRALAQTLDQARQVSRQSDDPLGDVTDKTWEALGAAS